MVVKLRYLRARRSLPLMKRAKAWTALFFLGLFLLTPDPRTVGMGHASRLDLTKAIVHHGSFVIDDYVKNTIDWSYAGSHYYTNKAPGFPSLPYLLLGYD